MSALAYPVLADSFAPRDAAGTHRSTAVRHLAVILAGTAMLWAAAQIVVPLPFTPVPLSMATFGVLLVGAALGPARALASTGLYVIAGVLGAPMYAGFASGWEFASFGYILGYVAAALLVGAASRVGADRRVLPMAGSALLGSAAIYAFGVAWLMPFLGVGLGEALALGVIPVLIGDAVKIGLAALALPVAWRAVAHITKDS